MKPLNQLELPWKLLITMFLIVLSSGFVVSELYLQHTTSMADGIEGMSIDDITFTFYGDRRKTGLKKQVQGSMKKYFAEGGDLENLKPEDQADIDAVIKWNDSLAQLNDEKKAEEGYWDPKEKDKTKDKTKIFKILDNHGCYDCHSKDATMKGNKKDSPLDNWKGISKFIAPDTGMDKSRLLSISHVHLLGMGMMFLLVGATVAASLWPSKRVRCALIVGGLSSVLIDIFGWWAVKWFGAPMSPMVMFSGILMACSFGGSVFVAMVNLWLRPPGPKEPPVIVEHKGATVAGE